MKNKEKFAKEIVEISCNGNKVAVDKESEYEEPKIQPEVKNCKIDDRVLVSNNGKNWFKRYFAKYDNEKDLVYAWSGGRASWNEVLVFDWKYAKLPDSEV